MSESFIGQSINRIDGSIKVTGKAEYIRDMEFPNLLEAVVLGSTLASGKIVSLDVSEAAAMPGVITVMTGNDVEGLYGTTIVDRPILAKGRVRFYGEPVAAVAAVNKAIAKKALAAIKVEYESLPAVFDPVEAAQPGAFIIHDDMMKYEKEAIVNAIPGTNICSHFKLRKGNVEEGFAKADFVFEEDYEVPRNHHACIEPYGVVAQFEREGTLHIWTGNQSPYVLQRNLAALFGLPWNKVRITIPTLGGGFGSKIYPSLEPIAVALAKRCGNRPVRFALDREEDFIRVANHSAKIRLKTGVLNNGKIVARQLTTYWDGGGYADCTPLVARNSGFTSAGPYQIDHVQVDAYAVYTNLPVATAFRGYGIPHVTWAYERQLDHIAAELGLDPIEIRRINLVKTGDVSHTGEMLKAVGIRKCLDALLDAAHIENGRLPEPESLGNGIYRSYGLACSWKGSMRHYGSSATVRIMEDGSIEINKSNVDMGQGSDTAFAQIVAEELGADIKNISVKHADTFMTPYDRTTSASRGTFHNGTAVRNAAIDARRQMLDHAVKVFKCEPSNVAFDKGKARNLATGDELVFGALLKKAVLGGIDVIGVGYSNMEGGTGLDKETGYGENPTSFWMYAADLVETEIDTKTGVIKVNKIYAASDVGKAINRRNCEMQIQGGVMMGLGIGLMEELKHDTKGRTINNNLHDYKIPTAADSPQIIALVVEEPHPLGPYGVKGLGEAPVGPCAPAIANAVYRATGVKVHRCPMTPEAMQKAFEKAGVRDE